jgi:hypothetical protein
MKKDIKDAIGVSEDSLNLVNEITANFESIKINLTTLKYRIDNLE